jgi:hypothetical protein
MHGSRGTRLECWNVRSVGIGTGMRRATPQELDFVAEAEPLIRNISDTALLAAVYRAREESVTARTGVDCTSDTE